MAKKTDASVDLSDVFDRNRDSAVRDFVDRFENLMRDRDDIGAGIRDVAAEAKKFKFSPAEIKAMKDIARLRKDDKRLQSAAALAALRRVGHACEYDLFTWAAPDGEP